MKQYKSLFALSAATLAVGALGVSLAGAQGIPGSGWWSGHQIQNVSTITATVSLEAYDSTSVATVITTSMVAPGASYIFNSPSISGISPGFVGSAIVSSDQPVRAVNTVLNSPGPGFGVTGGKAVGAYQGVLNPSTTIYFPLFKNNRFWYSTAHYVQNAGSSVANIQAVFTADDGNVYTHTISAVDPGDMVVFTPMMAGVPTSNANRANIGSAIVSSLQPLAGVSMEFLTTENPATVLFSTRAATSSDFDDKAFAPVVKRTRFGKFTGIQILNVTSSPITATITYTGRGGACAGNTYTDIATDIPPFASRTVIQGGSSSLPDNCVASAIIVATGDFVSLVNEASTTSTPSGIVQFAVPDNSVTVNLVAPTFKNNRFGQSTGLAIQNTSVTTATITATFKCSQPSPQTLTSSSISIAPGGSHLFFKPTTGFTPTNFPTNALCAVTVVSDQPIVGVVNETRDNGDGALDDANYEVFNVTP